MVCPSGGEKYSIPLVTIILRLRKWQFVVKNMVSAFLNIPRCRITSTG